MPAGAQSADGTSDRSASPGQGPPGNAGHPAPADNSALLAQRDAEQAINDRVDAEIKLISQGIAFYRKKVDGKLESVDMVAWEVISPEFLAFLEGDPRQAIQLYR